MRASVITVSTRAASGVYEDSAGPAVAEVLQQAGFSVAHRIPVVPDDRGLISSAIVEACAAADVVVTNGGTGVHPRDVTPEATLAVLDRVVPGMAEAMRADSLRQTPMAMLSRGVAGVRGRTLVLNLPGSPRGAVENLTTVVPVLAHALDQLHEGDHHRQERA